MTDVISTLEKLISINSINPFKTIEKDGKIIGIGNEKEITDYLEKSLIINSFKVTRQLVQEEIKEKNVPKRYNLLAEKGTGTSSLLFLGHMDTVDIKEGWKTNPLNTTIKDGRIYALGSNDMKAGIAVILESIKNINPENYKIKIAFVVDEEFWSYGGAKLLESEFLSDVKLAIVPEIGDFNKKTENQSIVLGRMGRTEYEFNVTGVACHGAQSRINKKVINAVHQSTKLQNKIIKYYEDNKKTFSSSGVSITNSAYISYQNGGKAILSVPDKASFIVDRSFVMNESMDQEIEILKELITKAYDEGILDSRVKITVKERKRPTHACKPYFFSEDNKGIKYVTEIVDNVTGGHEYGIAYSVADENRLAELDITTVVLGPKGSNSHAAQEWVDIESVKNLTKIYKKIVKNFNNFLIKNKKKV